MSFFLGRTHDLVWKGVKKSKKYHGNDPEEVKKAR